ncbi:hypothetical protein ACNJUT_22090, partial [Mycobacterium tuberculosis]
CPSGRAVIPLTGPSAGAVVLGGAATVASQLNGLVIGMQYAYTTPSASTLTQGFQVLDARNTPSFNYVAAFDPLDPLCVGPASAPAAGVYRTLLAAAPGTPALASFYRTVNNA